MRANVTTLQGNHELSGVRVLIAEDCSALSWLFAEILTQRGASVTLASTMRSALHDLFSTHDFDAFLCDIALEDGDGLTLLRTLRVAEEATGQHLPSAAVTGLASVKNHLDAVRAGFDEYIAKPIMPEELVSLVKRLSARSPRPMPIVPQKAGSPRECSL